MAIITTIITVCSLLVLQVKDIPAENNPYYQKNKTEENGQLGMIIF